MILMDGPFVTVGNGQTRRVVIQGSVQDGKFTEFFVHWQGVDEDGKVTESDGFYRSVRGDHPGPMYALKAFQPCLVEFYRRVNLDVMEYPLATPSPEPDDTTITQRQKAADSAFDTYDFGEESVKDTDAWQQEANVWQQGVYLEKPGGQGPSRRVTFMVVFSQHPVDKVTDIYVY